MSPQVWPSEAFEDGAEFLESLSKSFANTHGLRLKIAFAEALVQLLHPVGKVYPEPSQFRRLLTFALDYTSRG